MIEPSVPQATEPDEAFSGRFSGTRRRFIRGVAAAGASTMLATSLQRAGALDLFAEPAVAAEPTPFSSFNAIAASPADAFQVPEGFRADIIIKYGDRFTDDRGNAYTYGYNNDYLAYFPLDGSTSEGLLFVNHEYTAPFFLHGYKPEGGPPPSSSPPNPDYEGKSAADIALEQSTIGNSIVHVRQGSDGVWRPVNGSRYNRRYYAGRLESQPGWQRSEFDVTGPLAGAPGIGTTIWGTLGNCSGGTTPWGTALSCEENFDGYGLPLPSDQDFVYGWADPSKDGTYAGNPDYNPGRGYRTDGPDNRKYGWVCEHDPYDPDATSRKHTALGRFRHENTAFRHEPGKKFVIYMGDDGSNDCVYKFVSSRSYIPGDRANNLQILESGKLYAARWTPESRRRFTTAGDVEPVTPEAGAGTWVEIPASGLSDTRGYLRNTFASTYNANFATNRPEDVEVHPDGSVYIAFTNNSGVNDVHGAVRKLDEAGNDPEAGSFTWRDYSSGGPEDKGGQGFSCPDNLHFDSQQNLWVVTDISTGSLPPAENAQLGYHANNALFMIPTSGDNAGVAYRFANMPIQAEGTGPYFTPDESTLFINVQHPGEQSGVKGSSSKYQEPSTYTSYWPNGNKTTGQNPSEPIPSTVAITRVRPDAAPGTPVIPPPPATVARPDRTRPRVNLLSPRRQSLSRFRTRGMSFRIQVDEPVTLRVTTYGQLTSRRRRKAGASARGKLRRFARKTVNVEQAGTVTVRLRPRAALRVLLRREQDMPGLLAVWAVDRAGNRATRTKTLLFK